MLNLLSSVNIEKCTKKSQPTVHGCRIFSEVSIKFCIGLRTKTFSALETVSFLINSYRRYFSYYFMRHRYYSVLLNYFPNKFFFFWIFILFDFARYEHVQMRAVWDAASQLCQIWKLLFILTLSIIILPSDFEVKVTFFKKIWWNISLWC